MLRSKHARASGYCTAQQRLGLRRTIMEDVKACNLNGCRHSCGVLLPKHASPAIKGLQEEGLDLGVPVFMRAGRVLPEAHAVWARCLLRQQHRALGHLDSARVPAGCQQHLGSLFQHGYQVCAPGAGGFSLKNCAVDDRLFELQVELRGPDALCDLHEDAIAVLQLRCPRVDDVKRAEHLFQRVHGDHGHEQQQAGHPFGQQCLPNLKQTPDASQHGAVGIQAQQSSLCGSHNPGQAHHVLIQQDPPVLIRVLWDGHDIQPNQHVSARADTITATDSRVLPVRMLSIHNRPIPKATLLSLFSTRLSLTPCSASCLQTGLLLGVLQQQTEQVPDFSRPGVGNEETWQAPVLSWHHAVKRALEGRGERAHKAVHCLLDGPITLDLSGSNHLLQVGKAHAPLRDVH
eukprot:48169-Chlamydomonas_euryale.AAC.7